MATSSHQVQDKVWGQRGCEGTSSNAGGVGNLINMIISNSPSESGNASPQAELGSAWNALLWLLPKAGNTQPKEVHSLEFCF